MMFKISEKANPNYLSQIVRLDNIVPHPNADRLQIAVIQGNSVIVSLDAKEGDVYVYFPLECAINKEFLSWGNSFSDKSMNADKEVVGFFNSKGRVRAVKLRSVPSMGYALPFDKFCDWLKEKTGKSVDFKEDLINKEFDSYGDILVCEKYVNPVALSKQNKEKKNQKKVVREPKVVDSQFHFHINTPQLRKLINNISPNDYIAITRKLHGTSWVAARLLCNKRLTWREHLLEEFGVDINTSEYDLLWASRKVLKNGYREVDIWRYVRELKKKIFKNGIFGTGVWEDIREIKRKIFEDTFPNSMKNHFYSYDLWEDIAKSVEYGIQDSITLYGESVGYTKTGSFIQNGYDYGCKPGTFKTYIYRITTTNQSGQVYEFSHNQVKDYCEKFGLTMVPELYYGKAKDLYPDLSVKEHWHENFLQRLIEDYLEKDCDLCKSQKVPDEGICLRKDIFDIEVYKLKSFKFLEWETKQLDDENYLDMESQDA